MRAWIADLKEKGLAPATVLRIYQEYKRMMAVAVMDGYRARTPCLGVKLPVNEAAREEPVYLTAKQVLALANAIAPRYRALVLVGAFGGLRLGEMAALLAEDVRLKGEDPHIIVRASMEDQGHGQRRKTTKTDKIRRVSLPKSIAAQVAEHMRDFPPNEDGHVFSTERGSTIQRRNFLQREFRPAIKAAGPGLPEHMRVHDLRHTCAALLISAGESLSMVAKHLGHSTERTTERYKHLLPSAHERAIARLEAAYEEAIAA